MKEETPIEALIRKADASGVALDLRTGEFIIATPEQKALMANPEYQKWVQMLMSIALAPRRHVQLRDIGRA